MKALNQSGIVEGANDSREEGVDIVVGMSMKTCFEGRDKASVVVRSGEWNDSSLTELIGF
jgi:hypothetical protein